MGVLIVGDVDRTLALLNVAALWTLVLAIDFVISFSYTIWPPGDWRSALRLRRDRSSGGGGI